MIINIISLASVWILLCPKLLCFLFTFSSVNCLKISYTQYILNKHWVNDWQINDEWLYLLSQEWGNRLDILFIIWMYQNTLLTGSYFLFPWSMKCTGLLGCRWIPKCKYMRLPLNLFPSLKKCPLNTGKILD